MKINRAQVLGNYNAHILKYDLSREYFNTKNDGACNAQGYNCQEKSLPLEY